MTPSPPDGPISQSLSIGFRAVAFGLLVLAGAWAVSNWRQVQPDSQAVVLRFGRIERIGGPGLTIAWPRPMGEVALVPARDRLLVTHSAAAPRLAGLQDVFTDASNVAVQPGADSFLTGDGGVVLLGATITYSVSDAAAYYVSREHVVPALQRVFHAAAVGVAATRVLDDFLVARSATAAATMQSSAADRLRGLQDRREALRGDIVAAMNARLATLAEAGASTGVAVARVDLDPALPPQARIAFDGVLVAAQMAEQTIATARTQATQAIQAAQRERDQILTDARANAAERVGAAQVRTAPIVAVQASFTPQSRPAMVEQLYREQIAGIMHRVGRVVTVDRGGGHVIVPAELNGTP